MLQTDDSLASESSSDKNDHSAGGNRLAELGRVANGRGALFKDHIFRGVVLAHHTRWLSNSLVFKCEFLHLFNIS